MMEIFGIVKSYKANGNDSVALTIPKSLQEKEGIGKGKQFVVYLDEKGRIVYEPKKD
jgi:bifunctional DNA-binding transcriptional regulator/antitoxin component of YhaV-PrlF toxin-antitoxin module